ncbi:hypothetical protein C812_03265 [Paenibacillus barengoltzii G22]|uniref:Uncharacterized protein n=1 Tax=Paenibacillus barengoltzii G22 TaxID=1235795 RepID=R9L743_9BACL|nr:hypothetical protein C812_03265 [Paenibacillus barengoltzii G22]
MERVIAVSLSEWVSWLQSPDHAALAAFLALSAFLALYVASRNKLIHDERIRLDYINSTLERYAAAAGSLMSATESSSSTLPDPSALRDKLLACRAAPYVSENVLAQISAFTEDDDASRLPLLLRTIERESETLIAERDKLLRQMEGPGWGSWLWRIFRPVLPGVLAAAFFISLLWLWHLLDTSLSSGAGSESARELALDWMQLASTWFALLMLSLAVMGGRNRHVNAVPARLLAALIAVLAVGHWAGSWLAPYLLGAQLLLFLGGFRLNSRKPRRARPYVGHDPLPMTPKASDAVSSEAVQALSHKGDEGETTQ